MKYLIIFFRESYDEICEKIKAKLDEKMNENFIGKIWKLDGNINFSQYSAIFHIKIKNMH